MMIYKIWFFFALIVQIGSDLRTANGFNPHLDGNFSALLNSDFPDISGFTRLFSSSESDCGFSNSDSDHEEKQTAKLSLTRMRKNSEAKDHFKESATRDLTRIQSLHKRIMKKKIRTSKNSERVSVPESHLDENSDEQLMATLASGFSIGSGEYLMDVFIGTPPRHFSLILDTGSDLSWIQCVPCHDCFEQNGPYYDPKLSTSYKNISCNDPRCGLVSSPDSSQHCKTENQSCPYYYWYGDSSNTTGDLALETFTVNLTSGSGKPEHKHVENVMFGCGHWNRGLFHGAAGLIGLGMGPLSLPSQLKAFYGHSFSYCLVDRSSESNVSGKLIFGEDKNLLSHPELNFTSLVTGKDNLSETFYYLQIKSIIVGGEILDIPEEIWKLSGDGVSGTIIDSGTTLSYFPDSAYKIIKDAFFKKIQGFRKITDFPLLDPCYNISGVEKMELPDFAIVFADGAVWNFPVENYFIWLEPEDVVCLAILGTNSDLTIIGNYQQQNFHVLYDTKRSRLGYAPMKCSNI